MELLFKEGGPALEVIGIGGTLRRLTRSFVGPFAVRTVQGHFADRLFLSVKGIAANGMLTDADPLEAELKRTMIEQAGESVLLIDHIEAVGARAERDRSDRRDRDHDRDRARRGAGRHPAARRHDRAQRLKPRRRPSSARRCSATKAISIGSVASTTAAKIGPHWAPYWPTKP